MKTSRNILTILILSYVLALIISVFVEFRFADETSKEIMNTLQIASDTAILQLQTSDDFFTKSDGFNMNTKTDYQINLNNQNVNLFATYTQQLDKERIYDTLYTNNNNFNEYVRQNRDKLEKIEDVHNYKIKNRTYNVATPRIANLGGKYFNMFANSSLDDEYVKQTQLSKKAKTLENSDFYITPLSDSITYVDKDLLQVLFMNNVEMIMKSNSNQLNPGAYKGLTHSHLVDTIDDSLHVVHNKNFSVVLGNKSRGFYTGTQKPTIEYKLIDAYDSSNNEILLDVFGRTAEQIKEKDKMNIDTRTNKQFKNKYIIVAKIKFYLDVIVPYKTPLLRELKALENKDKSQKSVLLFDLDKSSATKNNYLDIKDRDKRFRTVTYTRLFAVM